MMEQLGSIHNSTSRPFSMCITAHLASGVGCKDRMLFGTHSFQFWQHFLDTRAAYSEAARLSGCGLVQHED